jgi:hypothetical protein
VFVVGLKEFPENAGLIPRSVLAYHGSEATEIMPLAARLSEHLLISTGLNLMPSGRLAEPLAEIMPVALTTPKIFTETWALAKRRLP